jgi:hypothetical protein
VEFKGGRSYTVKFRKPMKNEEVADALETCIWRISNHQNGG